MNWIVAGLIAGVVAWLVDWLMWGKIFTKGMDLFMVQMSPEEMKKFMMPAMVKSFLLALVFGVILANFYGQFKSDLWVQPGGPLAGMEFGAVLWLPTIALATVGSGIWYIKARPLQMATFWAWLARLLAAGLAVGLLMK
ncbi:MAG TPA: hypothetical protein VNZ06_06820 [Steroidobacteraceae bacterium]|nr:hypothetical protein [Steroidobacteraceae bacterium]